MLLPTSGSALGYEPFVQVDAGRNREAVGSGLGLAISRRLARLMGGDLTMRSTLDVGTTVLLWLACVWAEQQPCVRGVSAAQRE